MKRERREASGEYQAISGTSLLDFNRHALFLDVDGTLLDIAPTPDSVVVTDGLVANLALVATALNGALAMITGRALHDLDRLFRPLRTRAAGVHGAQMRFDPDYAIAVGGADPLPEQLRRKLEAVLINFPLAMVENKRFAYAIHYRAAPGIAADLRAALEQLLEDEKESDLQLLEAHCAFEIKQRGFNKGLAIERFMTRQPFEGRTPIFVGDDVTDEDGFAVTAAHHGLAYSVGRARPWVAAVFSDPASVREWLGVAARSAVGVS